MNYVLINYLNPHVLLIGYQITYVTTIRLVGNLSKQRRICSTASLDIFAEMYQA